jgi:hypothetical protein
VGTAIQFVKGIVDGVVGAVLEVGKIVGSQFPVKYDTVIEPPPVVWVDDFLKWTVTAAVATQSTDILAVGNLTAEFIVHFGISNHKAEDEFKIYLCETGHHI